MKKIGRGASYRTALINNLAKSLLAHQKITTTKSRGKILSDFMQKTHKTVVTSVLAKPRRGDYAPQVVVEIKKDKEDKKEVNKDKENAS